MIPAGPWKQGRLDRTNCMQCPCGLFIPKLPIRSGIPGVRGKRLLFMSDFHIRTERVSCREVPQGGWEGADWVRRAVAEAFHAVHPDIFIFGGDLIGQAVWIPESLQILEDALPAGPDLLKIAIPGNWERRRERWLGRGFWRREFTRIGFHFLSNDALEYGPFWFYGMDDFKSGSPACPEKLPSPEQCFNCVLAHNPDSIPQFIPPSMLNAIPLILCGHTHGGQIRIPGFGAIRTSSVYGKKFERGLYRNTVSGTSMAVSAGIGTTWFPRRINCPPEALHVEFL